MTNVDPAYAAILDNLDQEPAPPREVGVEPIPRFDYYHVKFLAATGGVTSTGTPYVRPTAQILNGPDGSVGRIIADDLYLTVKDTVREIDPATNESTERPKTQEEMGSGIERLRKTFRRLASALNLTTSAPAALDEASINAWASQFADREAVVSIRIEKARGNYPARNRFVWLSLAAPSDPAKAENGGYANALAEAQARIERFNSKSRGNKLGRSLGGLRPRATSMQ